MCTDCLYSSLSMGQRHIKDKTVLYSHTHIYALSSSPCCPVYRFCKLRGKTLFAFCGPKVMVKGWLSSVWIRCNPAEVSTLRPQESRTKQSHVTSLSPACTFTGLWGIKSWNSPHLPAVILTHTVLIPQQFSKGNALGKRSSEMNTNL